MDFKQQICLREYYNTLWIRAVEFPRLNQIK